MKYVRMKHQRREEDMKYYPCCLNQKMKRHTFSDGWKGYLCSNCMCIVLDVDEERIIKNFLKGLTDEA